MQGYFNPLPSIRLNCSDFAPASGLYLDLNGECPDRRIVGRPTPLVPCLDTGSAGRQRTEAPLVQSFLAREFPRLEMIAHHLQRRSGGGIETPPVSRSGAFGEAYLEALSDAQRHFRTIVSGRQA
jgi:hypothetical protein